MQRFRIEGRQDKVSKYGTAVIGDKMLKRTVWNLIDNPICVSAKIYANMQKRIWNWILIEANYDTCKLKQLIVSEIALRDKRKCSTI